MNTPRKLAALVGAGALVLAVSGTAVAHLGASTQGITPTLGASTNIGFGQGANTDNPACVEADGVVTGNTGGTGTSDNGVTVTWTYDSEEKEVAFTATGGLVTYAYIKGGSGYNIYDYTGLGGVASDGHLHAPDTNDDGNVQGLSHALFCTGPGTVTSSSSSSSSTTSFSQTQSGTETSSTSASFSQTQSGTVTQEPTDTIGGSGSGQQSGAMWLLIAGLGALVGSLIVVAPSRGKTRQ